jgi:hypothetical protein
LSDDKKKPFLTTDYSQLEEIERNQESCEHGVYEVLDKDSFHGTYRTINTVDFCCVKCGKIFTKQIKNKRK